MQSQQSHECIGIMPVSDAAAIAADIAPDEIANKLNCDDSNGPL